jgi:hypothetical protein
MARDHLVGVQDHVHHELRTPSAEDVAEHGCHVPLPDLMAGRALDGEGLLTGLGELGIDRPERQITDGADPLLELHFGERGGGRGGRCGRLLGRGRPAGGLSATARAEQRGGEEGGGRETGGHVRTFLAFVRWYRSHRPFDSPARFRSHAAGARRASSRPESARGRRSTRGGAGGPRRDGFRGRVRRAGRSPGS